MKITLNSTRPNSNCHFEFMLYLLNDGLLRAFLFPDVRCFDIKIVSESRALLIK
jgi:hypothetical protein